jgi:hypothetical protein
VPITLFLKQVLGLGLPNWAASLNLLDANKQRG